MSDISVLKKEGLKGSAWNFLNMAVNQTRNFIVSLVLARLLMPSDFGLISMALVLNTILDSIVDFGLGNAVIRKEKITETELSTVFWINILLGGFCTLTVFLSAPLFEYFFEMPQLGNIVRITSFSFLISSFGTLQTALFQKKLNFKAPFIAKLISGLISGIGGIILALLDFGVWALVFSNTAGWLFNSTILWIISSWHPKMLFQPSQVKELWNFGWKMTLTTIINRVFRQLDTFIIGKLYSAASLGLFNRAKSLNNLVIECSFSAIRSTMLPTFSKLQNDVELLRNSIIKLIHVISFLTFLFAGIMYMCADDLIIILYGNKWEGAIEIFKILGLFSITICLPVVYDAIISVVNRMSLYLWIGIIRNMILLIAIPFGIIYGFHAYIWSVSIASGINLIPYFFAANTCIQLPVASQIYTIVRYVAPFIFAILLWQIIDYSSRNHFIDIFLKSIYFLCTYVGYNMWAKNNGYVICQTLIKNTVAKNKK